MVYVELSKKLFNNLYWHLMEHMQDPAIRYIWLRGGSSASKTYTFCQAQIRLMLESSDENALVMRKFGSDIFDSIYEIGRAHV